MADLGQARRFALSLPGASEEPHFAMTSFRVMGKIFATAPPDQEHLHVFVDEAEITACVAEDPRAYQPLHWGKQVRGLRVVLAAADPERVAELLAESWRRKAPRRLIAERDGHRATRPGSGEDGRPDAQGQPPRRRPGPLEAYLQTQLPCLGSFSAPRYISVGGPR